MIHSSPNWLQVFSVFFLLPYVPLVAVLPNGAILAQFDYDQIELYGPDVM